MEAQKTTKRHARVIVSLQAFIVDAIDAECERNGDCSRACIVRKLLREWALAQDGAAVTRVAAPVKSVVNLS